MALETGVTTQSDLSAWIRTEGYAAAILRENEAPSVHQTVAWVEDASMIGSNTFKFRREKNAALVFTYASPKAEGDDGGYGNPIKFEVAAASCNGAVIGIKRAITYRASQNAMVDLERVTQNNSRAMAKRMSQDMLTKINDASTNTTNYSGLQMDRAKFGALAALYSAQEAEGQHAVFMGHHALEKLRDDIRQTNGAIEATGRGLSLFGTNPLFKGDYEGYPILVSDYLPDPDGANKVGCFAVVGDEGAFGIASWWGTVPGRNPGNDAVVNGYFTEFDRDPDKDKDLIYTKAYVAHCLTYEGNIRRFVVAKS